MHIAMIDAIGLIDIWRLSLVDYTNKANILSNYADCLFMIVYVSVYFLKDHMLTRSKCVFPLFWRGL